MQVEEVQRESHFLPKLGVEPLLENACATTSLLNNCTCSWGLGVIFKSSFMLRHDIPVAANKLTVMSECNHVQLHLRARRWRAN